MQSVCFYYDVVCPYAYAAATQIERICSDGASTLVWRPMLLSGLLRLRGLTDTRGGPISEAKWARRRALVARAKELGVRIDFHPEHPRRTVDAMRLLAATQLTSSGRTGHATASVPLTLALFESYWGQGQDVNHRDFLGRLAREHGLDAKVIDTSAARDQLRSNTDEAAKLGMIGAPSFAIHLGDPSGAETVASEPRVFFGFDQLGALEAALRDGESSTPTPSGGLGSGQQSDAWATSGGSA